MIYALLVCAVKRTDRNFSARWQKEGMKMEKIFLAEVKRQAGQAAEELLAQACLSSQPCNYYRKRARQTGEDSGSQCGAPA